MALSVIQQAHGSAVGAGVVVLTIAAPAAGNALIVGTCRPAGQSSSPIASISGGGVTWTAYPIIQTDSSDTEIWAGLNSSGAGTSVTVTFGGAYGTQEAWIIEVAGMVTSGTPTDGTNTVKTAGMNPASASITPSAGVDIIIFLTATCAQLGNITGRPASFTTLTGAVAGECYYRIVTAPSGSYAPAWTTSSNYTTLYTAVAAFQATAGGGGANFFTIAFV